MNFLDAVLTTEVIAGVLIISGFAMAIRSVLHFTKEASDLHLKLGEIERELSKLRDGMGEKKKAVDSLSQAVAPIRERESKIRLYYEELREADIAEEKKEQAQEEEKEAQRQKRVQRKKMGL